MVSRNLENRTKEMLKDWYLGNLPKWQEEILITSLISELGIIKRNQVDKIRKIYLK